jgi:hypothetical protein
MSERPSFLPPAEFVHVAAEPAGFAAAYGTARRRRRRQVGEAGLALGLAVALLGGLNLPTRESGQDRVGVTDGDAKQQREHVVADDAATDAETVVALPQSSASPPAPGRSVSGRRAGTPRTVPGTQPVAGPRATAPASRPRTPADPLEAGLAYKKPLTREETTPIVACATTGWCASMTQMQIDGDNHYTLTFQLCRALDAAPVAVDFDNDREAEFVVSRGDVDYWTWSRAQRFSYEPETITFGAGTCYSWHDDYVLTVDDYGELLDPGDYTVKAWSYGTGVGTDVIATTTITVA